MEILSKMFLLPLFFIFMMVLSCKSDNSSDELELVSELNANRQQQGMSDLAINPNLNCMATSCTGSYNGMCDSNFIPDIGQLASDCNVLNTDNSSTKGYTLCKSEQDTPKNVIASLKNTTEDGEIVAVFNQTFTLVGASFTGTNSGGPYFWCIIVHSGNFIETSTLYTPPPPPTGMTPPPRCYGGSCNNAPVSTGYKRRSYVIGIVLFMIFVHLV